MLVCDKEEREFVDALLDLVKQGDLVWQEAAVMYRDEYQSSVEYMCGVGLIKDLKHAATVIPQKE